MPADRYFVYGEDGRQGPFTWEELDDLVAEGEIGEESRCSTESAEVFHAVGEILDQGPPPPDPVVQTDPTRAESLPIMGDTPPVQTDSGLGDEETEEEREPRSRPLYRGHPTLLSYPRSLLLATALAVGGFFSHSLHPALGVAGIALALLIVVGVGVERSFRLYLVSRRRVELVYGIFAKSSRELRIEDIRAINVNRSGLLGILGIGTVEFSSAGSDEVEVAFDDVWAAQRVKGIVRKLQDRD